MSPRRRVDSNLIDRLEPPATRPLSRRFRLIATIAAVLILSALVTTAVVFANNQADRRTKIDEAAVQDFVRTFVTQYTSPDPFNANDYADKILALGTGNFAKMYSDRMNEVVLQVAQSEPGFGTVADLGIERWNADGSASVIAVANMTTKMPDGTKIDSASRWEITAVKEGDQWKVSDLIQVL